MAELYGKECYLLRTVKFRFLNERAAFCRAFCFLRSMVQKLTGQRAAVHNACMHLTGAAILILFIVAATASMLLLLHLTNIGVLIHQDIPDRPRRRLFLASVSFFITFAGVRLLVRSITHHDGPFGWVMVDGRHIHHLVWGILLLLVVGYATLAEVGTSGTPVSIFLSRLLSILYGVGAALTLDEFALWLNLEDVYWSRQGRESIDAVILFGAALAAGAWGAPLFAALRRRGVKRG